VTRDWAPWHSQPARNAISTSHLYCARIVPSVRCRTPAIIRRRTPQRAQAAFFAAQSRRSCGRKDLISATPCARCLWAFAPRSACAPHRLRRWARERRLSECADGDNNVLLAAFGHVVDCRTAGWAEVEYSPAACVADTNEPLRSSANGYRVRWEACLGAKDTTVLRWQARQWQTETRSGSAEAIAIVGRKGRRQCALALMASGAGGGS